MSIDVLVPVPPDADVRGSEHFDLTRPVDGVRIGLRLDPAWRSYYTVVDEWERLLTRDGARVHVLVTGERVGPAAAETRADLDEWARLIEVAVIGLCN